MCIFAFLDLIRFLYIKIAQNLFPEKGYSPPFFKGISHVTREGYCGEGFNGKKIPDPVKSGLITYGPHVAEVFRFL